MTCLRGLWYTGWWPKCIGPQFWPTPHLFSQRVAMRLSAQLGEAGQRVNRRRTECTNFLPRNRSPIGEYFWGRNGQGVRQDCWGGAICKLGCAAHKVERDGVGNDESPQNALMTEGGAGSGFLRAEPGTVEED